MSEERYTLFNFDEHTDENTRELLLTPRSLKACQTLAVNPKELLKKSRSHFDGKPHADQLFKHAERKRQGIIHDLQQLHVEISKTRNIADEAEARIKSEHDKVLRKQKKRKERVRRAMEIEVENTLHFQNKVKCTEQKAEEALKLKQEHLSLDQKRARNQEKKRKHKKAVEKEKQRKREKEQWLQQQKQKEDHLLQQKGERDREMDARRLKNAEMKNQRHNAKQAELEKQKEYKMKEKKKNQLRRDKRAREDEEQRKMTKEEKRLERQLRDEETREHQERLKKQKEFRNNQKMEARLQKEKLINHNQKTRARLKKEEKQKDQEYKDQLKREKAMFEEKVREVRNYGINQVAEQIKIISMFKRAGAPGKKNPFKTKASKSADSKKEDGVVLPPLPSSNTFFTEAPLSPKPPSSPKP